MQVEEIEVAKAQATKELDDLREIFKKDGKIRKQAIYADMHKVYGHLRNGKAVIDLWEAMKKTGLNGDGDPKLAIIRADAEDCFCEKQKNGSAIYRAVDGWKCPKDQMIITSANVYTWPNVVKAWKLRDGTTQNFEEIARPKLKCPVPMIPARILVDEVKHQLKNYYILWEVESWTPTPPKDPMLLKRLSPNLFGVLATWDLTPIERAIIRGQL